MTKDKRTDFILEKNRFEEFIRSLSEKYRIYSPSYTDTRGHFIEVDSPDKIKFNQTNSKLAVKSFFFPQVENLFVFDAETKELSDKENETTAHPIQHILFGVRPCDAFSISLLDAVFMKISPADPYYIKKRHSTMIISLACNHPRQTCFCTSVGCQPDSEKGADIIFFDLEDRFLIRPVTDTAEEILNSVRTLLGSATDCDQEKKKQLMLESKNIIHKDFEFDDLVKKLDNFNASYWNRIYEKCLGCGICTYLCPTCHCFDIADEVIESNGRRVRTWDSCMFSLFTLHASGHNPRPTQKERMRQRIMHKFNYAPKNYDQIFCVGCGRCIMYCPVNLDIRQLIKGIMEEE